MRETGSQRRRAARAAERRGGLVEGLSTGPTRPWLLLLAASRDRFSRSQRPQGTVGEAAKFAANHTIGELINLISAACISPVILFCAATRGGGAAVGFRYGRQYAQTLASTEWTERTALDTRVSTVSTALTARCWCANFDWPRLLDGHLSSVDSVPLISQPA